MGTREVAEAFSGHRFEETFDALAPDVVWVSPGQGRIEGRAAVVAACREAAEGMALLTGHEMVRFVVTGDDRVAAVDAVGRYADADGETFVSSADVYEFDEAGLVVRITSYTVEVGGPDPSMSPD
jgi:ketosteroid isomerase-like protein